MTATSPTSFYNKSPPPDGRRRGRGLFSKFRPKFWYFSQFSSNFAPILMKISRNFAKFRMLMIRQNFWISDEFRRAVYKIRFERGTGREAVEFGSAEESQMFNHIFKWIFREECDDIKIASSLFFIFQFSLFMFLFYHLKDAEWMNSDRMRAEFWWFLTEFWPNSDRNDSNDTVPPRPNLTSLPSAPAAPVRRARPRRARKLCYFSQCSSNFAPILMKFSRNFAKLIIP